MNVLGRSKRKKGLKLDFTCLACGREFNQTIETLLCDLTTVERKRRGEQTKYSEYVIPERIVCPRCHAVDQFELSGSTYLKLTGELLRAIAGGTPVDDSPIRFAHMVLQDGREIHPLEARDWYAQKVMDNPERADLRVKYANVLRNLGHHEESEAQYRAAVEIDPGEVEALVNLAFLHHERGETQAARTLAQQLIEAAPRSKHPQRREFAQGARLVLDGEVKPGEVEVTALAITASARAPRKGKPVRSARGASRKKKKRRSR